MKFQCEKTHLESAVQTVSRAVNARAPMPILANVLVRAEGSHVVLAATDLETTLRVEVPAQIEFEGACTLPSRLLSEVVGELPDGPVRVSDVGAQTLFECRSTRFKMNSVPADEYPSLPVPPSALSTSLPQKLLRNALKLTAVASATSEETRAVLQGVHMTLQETSATFVATDGRRLARLELTLPAAVETTQVAILPARAVAELQRLLKDTDEPLNFAFAAGTLYASLGNTLICARLLEGKFPNYRNLLPNAFTTTVLVDRELLVSGVRRALVMAQEKQTPRLIRLNLLETVVELSSNAPDVGAANDTVSIHKSGPDMEIAFNGKFLLDGLQTIGGTEVRLKLNEATSAAILEPVAPSPSYLYLLMPVRIQREEPVPAGAMSAT